MSSRVVLVAIASMVTAGLLLLYVGTAQIQAEGKKLERVITALSI